MCAHAGFAGDIGGTHEDPIIHVSLFEILADGILVNFANQNHVLDTAHILRRLGLPVCLRLRAAAAAVCSSAIQGISDNSTTTTRPDKAREVVEVVAIASASSSSDGSGSSSAHNTCH